MNSGPSPNTSHLKKRGRPPGSTKEVIAAASHLIKILPEQHTQLITAMQQTSGNVLASPEIESREVSKQIYQRVLKAVMTSSQDADIRFWHVSEIIFNEVFNQLDPNYSGLAITYAKLMPPHTDGIHSLYEVKTRGHAPWPDSINSKTFFGSTTLVGFAAVLQRAQDWNDTDNGRALVDIDSYERSSYAVPVLHGNLLAGVLAVSSTQSDFFKNPVACQLVAEYALLMGVALSDHEFHSTDLLQLRPMPPLSWQRKELAENYLKRIIAYAHTHNISRREAELQVQQEFELEFEKFAHTMLMQQEQKSPERKQSHHVPFFE